MIKQCSKCNLEKDLKEYNKDKNRDDGLYPLCKSCRKNFETIKYRETHKEHILEYYRKYREMNYEQLLLSQVKTRAKKKGLEFNLTLDDIQIPKSCPVLGLPLIKTMGNGRLPNSPSIDRIDSSKGYIKGNVMIISWRANDLKKDATFEELRKLAEFYGKYN